MIVDHGPRARRRAALTFDDGPSQWTPQILEILAAADARATFFVLGDRIAGHEATLVRAGREGHELGNHTYTHPRCSSLAEDELRAELQRTNEQIGGVVGTTPTVVRPPYGDGAAAVDAVAETIGLATTVLWSVDPDDWQQPPAETIVDRVLADVDAGAIVVLHDGFPSSEQHESRSRTVEAVRTLVPLLAGDGYELVTVSELVATA